MAYLARIETQSAEPIALPALAGRTAASPTSRRSNGRSSGLRGSTGCGRIRTAGRLRRFWNWLDRPRGNPELANERLEALRRMAVLTWHFGFTVPGDDVADFISAGFTPGPI